MEWRGTKGFLRKSFFTPDFAVTYQQSSDLLSWSTATPAAVTCVQLNTESNLVTAQFPLSTGRKFLRLQVTEQEWRISRSGSVRALPSGAKQASLWQSEE
jgi:hypothetical protein